MGLKKIKGRSTILWNIGLVVPPTLVSRGCRLEISAGINPYGSFSHFLNVSSPIYMLS